MYSLGIDTMFRGKFLPSFIEQSAPLYRRLIEQHGVEKVYKVYDYFFAFVSRMKWGQWMVLTRVCPDRDARQLFYWVMECIYQSDLCSQMRWEWAKIEPSKKVSDGPQEELRLVIVEPTPEQKQRLGLFMGDNCYLYIDWFGRLRTDPNCHPDINPEWLMLDGKNTWGDNGEDDLANLTSDGDTLPED